MTLRDDITERHPESGNAALDSDGERGKTMGKANTLRAVAAGAGVAAAAWSIFHPWALAVVAGCAVLTGAAVYALKRWSDGKVYYTATQPLQARAERVDPPPGVPLRKVIPGKAEPSGGRSARNDTEATGAREVLP